MLEICDVVTILPIYSQFEAIRKPDSENTFCETCIFIINNLLFYKNCKQN